uniref:Uncharacterized protein n=1 Tax=Clastoptera arizonana TaxID=38151 RepID=A0A1B6DME6_9HEMI
MPSKLNPTRYAHCEGHTGLCFSEDGKHIITCGNEGDVRVWADLEDDDPVDKCIGEKALAVFQKGTQLFVGSDSNTVQALTFPELELNGIITRFPAPVTHIDVSVDGKILASASSDMKINVTEIDGLKTETLRDHRAPVLSVAIDPKLEYLASSSCDGTVKVWKLSDYSVSHTWNCVPKSNSFTWSTVLCRISWQPRTGRFLAIPDKNEVILYERDTWNKFISFADPNTGTQFLSVTCFSKSGDYLAASTTQGHIYVWNTNGGNIIEKIQTDVKQHVCALAWNPDSNVSQLAFCDVQGNFGTIDDVNTEKSSNIQVEDNMDKGNIPLTDPIFGDSDDEDNENAISIEKIKNESGFGASLGLNDVDKASLSGDGDGRSSRLSIKSIAPALPPIELQPPFQPSSSPVHLQHRYMVWNDLGIVRQVNTEDETAIDVEFHDIGTHYPFRINNSTNNTIAALTAECLVLACDKQEDAPSKLTCILLNAWDGSKEWVAQLSDDEEILAAASGKSWVAVATDKRTLRVFTVAGTQREVISLPGPIVCLCGKDDKLVAVFHSGVGLNGDQCLSYFILRIGNSTKAIFSPTLTQAFPLSPKSTLCWLGFSDEDSLCSVDSAGSLRLLTPSMLWRPVCHLDERNKGKFDHYFVIGVSECNQNIRCVLCKGSFYPPTTPKPALTEVPWQIPICEPTIEKGELEEEFWRSQLAVARIEALSRFDDSLSDVKDNIDKAIKKCVLKLFALACQSGLEMRAVELCELMPTSEIPQLAFKYAAKVGKTQLAERISQVLKRKTEDESDEPVAVVQSYSSSNQDYTSIIKNKVSHKSVSNEIDTEEMLEDDTNQGQENLILSMKQKTSSTQNAVLSNKFKKENPFKKAVNGENNTSKGLQSLSKRPVFNKNISRQVLPEPVKQKSNENKPTKTNPFMEWFSSQKSNLEEEFPDLDTSELTKIAIKRFKEEKQKPSNNQGGLKRFLSVSSMSEESQNTENESQDIIESSQLPLDTKKRKLDTIKNKESDKEKNPFSKLKAFSFNK